MDGIDGKSIYELRFQKEAQSLRERYGIGLDDLTAWEVAALVHAVERVCSPFSDVNVELVERPVFVCKGVWLWPPTAGAQIWLDEYAARWWGEKSMRYKWAQVYALRNARDPEAFVHLTTKWEAEKAIVKCALCLPVHGRELQRALNRAYGIDPHDAPKGERSRAEKMREMAQTDFASLVARLEVQSGIPRSTWLWGRSLMYVATAYAQLHEFAAAFSAGGDGKRRMVDELDDALKNLARVKSIIVGRLGDMRKREGAERRENGPSGAPKEDA